MKMRSGRAMGSHTGVFSGKQRIVMYLIRQVWERKRTFLKDCKQLAFLSNLDFKKGKRLFAEVSFGD